MRGMPEERAADTRRRMTSGEARAAGLEDRSRGEDGVK